MLPITISLDSPFNTAYGLIFFLFNHQCYPFKAHETVPLAQLLVYPFLSFTVLYYCMYALEL